MKNNILTLAFIVFFAQLSFGQTSIQDFYKAEIEVRKQRHEINSGQAFPKGNDKDIIKVLDVANDYISYDLEKFGTTGYVEMTRYTSENGKDFVAMVSIACAPLCGLWDLNFFELENGQLINKTETYLSKSLRKQVVEMVELYKNQRNKVVWMKIPQNGRNIKIGYFNQGTMEFIKEDFKLVAELAYNKTTGTFAFVEK